MDEWLAAPIGIMKDIIRTRKSYENMEKADQTRNT
jgi:hypothetical protein